MSVCDRCIRLAVVALMVLASLCLVGSARAVESAASSAEFELVLVSSPEDQPPSPRATFYGPAGTSTLNYISGSNSFHISCTVPASAAELIHFFGTVDLYAVNPNSGAWEYIATLYFSCGGTGGASTQVSMGNSAQTIRNYRNRGYNTFIAELDGTAEATPSGALYKVVEGATIAFG